MFFQHVYDATLAQGSYVIACQTNGEAIVIDAQRDISIYLEIAKQNNLKITHIAETHIHADYLCGSRELAAATGAKMYLSDEGGTDWQYEFDHVGLKDGDLIQIGNLSFEVMHTPGHTPESISFLLTDHAATDKPVMLFSGDFVFVGDVGRPDLLETAAGIKGTKEEGARQMFQSLKRFNALPNHVQVWPAHGAGSACGKALGAVPSSTVGYEKIQNWALQFGDDEEGFVTALLEGQPEPPKYFSMMKKLNKVDRPLVMSVPKLPLLSYETFLMHYNEGVKVIDTRDALVFSEGFLPKSYNVQNNKSFATWCGWILNDEPFILIAKSEEIDDISKKLMSIGLDNALGYVSEINHLGQALQTIKIMDYPGTRDLLEQGITVVDVRNNQEFTSGHIKGALHHFAGHLEDHLPELDKEQPVLVHCQSGTRSAIASSILKRHGFEKVYNYNGGWADWMAQKGEIEIPQAEMG